MKVYICNRCGRVAHIVFAKGYDEDLCQQCYEEEKERREFKDYMDNLVEPDREIMLQ